MGHTSGFKREHGVVIPPRIIFPINPGSAILKIGPSD
jgi:hypothetical protein